MGSSGGRHVSNNVDNGLGSAVISGGSGGYSGISPDVQLDYEPWGHMDHSDGHCSCRSSDHTAAYVHELALMSRDLGVPSSDGGRGGGG